jgi:scyllo-inositol 2-dehydrogenase (NADP+)
MSIKTGIVGYGKSAKIFHAPLIEAVKELNFYSVVERSSDDAVKKYPNVEVFRNFKDILKDDVTKLLIITTPNHLHYPMAMEALSAGKHVVIDKPFTVTFEEAKKLVRVADDLNLKLSVFQNRRWDGDFKTVEQIIRDQKVGEVVEVISTFNRFRNQVRENKWREKDQPGSGVLYDLGPHLIDQSIRLFGKPDHLYADIREQRGGVTDDYFEVDLHYPNLKVKLKAGMLVADPSPRFTIRGTEGAFVKFGLDPQEQNLKEGINPKSPDLGSDSENFWGSLYKWKNNEMSVEKVKTLAGSYITYYREMAAAINGEGDLPVDPIDAAYVIYLIQLAIKSSLEGKRLDVSK